MTTFNRGNISRAKVTPELVLKMRELYSSRAINPKTLVPYTQRDFCSITGLSIAQVGKILRGEAWRQYPQPIHEDEIADSQARLASAEPILPEGRLLQELKSISPSNEVEAVDKFMQSQKETQNELIPTGESASKDTTGAYREAQKGFKVSGGISEDSKADKPSVLPARTDK